ncbi:outer membrane protein assembly factor BamB [Thalassotalea atypica]|uniref:outer membrane protein assembly factor BamB n=1 Tax=Thalassotalea atypica TaxID=2054316 RepID=UPI002573714B|nr:outer membrane protein assembly factor BamB [Thalassotalea atypica]
MQKLKQLKHHGKIALAVLLSSMLLACSSTDDEEDESIKVAELTDIQELFEPKVIWEKSVGDGVGHYFSRIKPFSAYGKIFSASRDGELIALNAETGDTVWSIDLSDVNDETGFFDNKKSALVSGGPIAAINKVFVGTENGEIFAFDAETGEMSWSNKVKGEIIARPAFDSGILVVNSASGVLKAFNATDGEELWKIDQDVPPLSLRGISAPTISGGGVILGSSSGDLTVYMLEKGQQGWTAPLGEATGSTELERVVDVDAEPVVYGDKVYAVSSRGNLAAVDIRNGRTLWKRQYSSYRQISIDGNTIYLTNVKGHVFAIDRINGLEKWSNLSLTNRGVTGPAVIDDFVVVGDFEGYLHWISRESGEIVARHEVDGSGIHATPTVNENILYSQSRDGDLQAIKTP